jgi:hypothetical protein
MRISTTLKLLVPLLSFAPGCQTMTGRSTGRYVDDQTIVGKVKSKLVADKTSA